MGPASAAARRTGRAPALLLLLLCAGAGAQVPLLDRVETRVDGAVVEARVAFTAPVHYVRHFPREQGELLLIQFRVVAVGDNEISLREEVRRVRPAAGMPGFTVTYLHPPSHDVVRDPLSLLIEFDRPVRYRVGSGPDKRSLYLRLSSP